MGVICLREKNDREGRVRKTCAESCRGYGVELLSSIGVGEYVVSTQTWFSHCLWSVLHVFRFAAVSFAWSGERDVAGCALLQAWRRLALSWCTPVASFLSMIIVALYGLVVVST